MRGSVLSAIYDCSNYCKFGTKKLFSFSTFFQQLILLKGLFGTANLLNPPFVRQLVVVCNNFNFNKRISYSYDGSKLHNNKIKICTNVFKFMKGMRSRFSKQTSKQLLSLKTNRFRKVTVFQS